MSPDTNHELTCACGWSETGSCDRVLRRARTHGFDAERHRWRVVDPEGDLVERGR